MSAVIGDNISQIKRLQNYTENEKQIELDNNALILLLHTAILITAILQI
jgi:hypothetical protein